MPAISLVDVLERLDAGIAVSVFVRVSRKRNPADLPVTVQVRDDQRNLVIIRALVDINQIAYFHGQSDSVGISNQITSFDENSGKLRLHLRAIDPALVHDTKYPRRNANAHLDYAAVFQGYDHAVSA